MKNIILFIVALLVFASCEETVEKSEVAQTKPSELVLNKEKMQLIKTTPATLIPDSDEFTAVGEVSFDEDHVVRVFPIVSGSVEKVYVSLGDYVKKGDLIATLLSTDISAYQREYNVAKNNLAVAEKNLARSKELFATNVISEKDLAESQKDTDNARYEFNGRKQVLELYGGSAEKADALFKISAPISGFIAERNVNEGTQIRADNNTSVFTISDLTSVWVWANVYESDLAKVQTGDSVEVTTIAYPDRVFLGTITKVSTILDPQSRVIKVRTELVNEGGLLKPEMFATVKIAPTRNNKVLVVPSSAIVLENSRLWVMKKTGEEKFVKVEVKVGKNVKQFTQILDGLSAGDPVVVEGSLFLQTAFNQM